MLMPEARTEAVTIPSVLKSYANGEKLVVVTAYDYTAAVLADTAGVDVILVGDSLGMVVQGWANPLSVTMRDMIYHTRCVARGAKRAMIVADLPFLSYQVSPSQAVHNAGRLLRAGAHAVKLEGGVRMADAVAACVRADIPVMGHIGLTPQSLHRMGGFKVQRNTEELLADTKCLCDMGVFAMVVEGVPTSLGQQITQAATVPTIGIGAGPWCNGQVLVWHDLLGLYDGLRPKFVKRYAELGLSIHAALQQYAAEVRDGTFPSSEHSFQ
jgi:3-methyl-2-oxobutanoate hydroxymethyltransferase